MSEQDTVRAERDARGVVTLTMDRPALRNAFDARLIDGLADAAASVAADPQVRVVVLTGAGTVFSAGADLRWMRSLREASAADNAADARRMADMLRALWTLPKPLIGRVNGHALGGGVGLVAVCDAAIAVPEATFAFSEVQLGLAPAVVSPYVVRKVGLAFARAAFVTGERFDAQRAQQAGLVHELAAGADALDAAVEATVARCLRAGPRAVAAAKTLPERALAPLDEAVADTAGLIAELRVSAEGQEGMDAFLQGRVPAWVLDDPRA